MVYWCIYVYWTDAGMCPRKTSNKYSSIIHYSNNASSYFCQSTVRIMYLYILHITSTLIALRIFSTIFVFQFCCFIENTVNVVYASIRKKLLDIWIFKVPAVRRIIAFLCCASKKKCSTKHISYERRSILVASYTFWSVSPPKNNCFAAATGKYIMSTQPHEPTHHRIYKVCEGSWGFPAPQIWCW